MILVKIEKDSHMENPSSYYDGTNGFEFLLLFCSPTYFLLFASM